METHLQEEQAPIHQRNKISKDDEMDECMAACGKEHFSVKISPVEIGLMTLCCCLSPPSTCLQQFLKIGSNCSANQSIYIAINLSINSFVCGYLLQTGHYSQLVNYTVTNGTICSHRLFKRHSIIKSCLITLCKTFLFCGAYTTTEDKIVPQN